MEYIAGFVLHRIKQKVFHLSNTKEKAAKLDLVNSLIRDKTVVTTSLMVEAKQCGGLLSAEQELVPFFLQLEFIISKHTSDNIVQNIELQSVVDQACFNGFCRQTMEMYRMHQKIRKQSKYLRKDLQN